MSKKKLVDLALEIIDKNTFELGKGLDVLKPTYRETVVKALEQAQKQEQEHIEYSKKVQEQFSNDTKRIGELESKLIIQEKLLDMYREYFRLNSVPKGEWTRLLFNRLLEVQKIIHELENNEN